MTVVRRAVFSGHKNAERKSTGTQFGYIGEQPRANSDKKYDWLGIGGGTREAEKYDCLSHGCVRHKDRSLDLHTVDNQLLWMVVCGYDDVVAESVFFRRSQKPVEELRSQLEMNSSTCVNLSPCSNIARLLQMRIARVYHLLESLQ